jgi:hypothetical protein
MWKSSSMMVPFINSTVKHIITEGQHAQHAVKLENNDNLGVPTTMNTSAGAKVAWGVN